MKISYPVWDIKEWVKVWVGVISKPRVAHFARLAQSSQVNLLIACLWCALGAVLANLIGLLLVGLGGVRYSSPLLLRSKDFVWLPLVTIGYIVTLLGGAGIIHMIARLLRGSGSYTQIAYLIAAFNFPLMIIVLPLFSVIRGNWAAVLSYGYWIILYFVAIKAVYGFSWIRVLIVLFLTLMVSEVCFISYFALLLLPRA